MPAGSGCPDHGRVSPSTPSAASSGQSSADRRCARAAATPSGPRNSIETAVPSGIRSSASTKASVITADAVPNASTPRTADGLKSRGRGRVSPSSTAAATDSRSQTEPAGDSAANRWVLSAAPSWTENMAARARSGAGTGPGNVLRTSTSIGHRCA